MTKHFETGRHKEDAGARRKAITAEVFQKTKWEGRNPEAGLRTSSLNMFPGVKKGSSRPAQSELVLPPLFEPSCGAAQRETWKHQKGASQ